MEERQLRKRLEGYAKTKRSNGERAFYGTASKGRMYPSVNTACHAGLRDVGPDQDLIWSTTKDEFGSQVLNPDHALRFYSWMLDRDVSPWRSLLGETELTPEWMVANGVYIPNPAKVVTGIVHHFFIATRIPWEQAYALSGWIRMVDAGVAPDIAFHAMGGVTSGGFFNQIRGTLNHSCATLWITEDHLKNFRAGVSDQTRTWAESRNPGYLYQNGRGIDYVWSPSPTGSSYIPAGTKITEPVGVYDEFLMGCPTITKKSTGPFGGVISAYNWDAVIAGLLKLTEKYNDGRTGLEKTTSCQEGVRPWSRRPGLHEDVPDAPGLRGHDGQERG